jgi:hypothetical protein
MWLRESALLLILLLSFPSQILSQTKCNIGNIANPGQP